MRFPLILHVFSSLCFAMTATLAISLSKPGCPEKCGDIIIPFPFGIGSKCSANSSFTIICQNSKNPPKPFLSGINVEVLKISLYGTVIVNQPVSPMNCSDVQTTVSLPISLKGSPFTISAHYNLLAVLGCKNSVWLSRNETIIRGCTAICDANSADTSCNGVNCCKTTIPTRLQELQYTYESNQGSNNSFCGYVFPVDKKWLQIQDYKKYKGLLNDLSNPFDPEFRFAPLVFEWEFGDLEDFRSGISLSKPGCPKKCGNVTIPYPFGIGSQCSANSSFTIICQNSKNPSTPFLSSINVEVLNILMFGILIVNQPVSPINCSEVKRIKSLPISLKGNPFTISGRYNALAVLGCKNSVWLLNNKMIAGGCLAICDANSTDTSCNGANCCQTTIPTDLQLQELQYAYESIRAGNNSFCGYVFPVDKKWIHEDYKKYKGLLSDMSNPFDPEFGFAPLVLEWESNNLEDFPYSICKINRDYSVTYLGGYCHRYLDVYGSRYPDDYCHRYPDDNCCQQLYTYGDEYHYYDVYGYASSTKYCSCPKGFEGNPYLPEGCRDIDECSKATLNDCPDGSSCINTFGDYQCQGYHPDKSGYDPYREGFYEDKNDGTRHIIKIASISIGSVLGSLILLVAAWKSSKAVGKKIEARRKNIFFKRNGGLLLEQQLSATENGLEKTKLFSSEELAKATDHYNENRILGRGGQGTVYKGMLADGRIVAVKKSKRVDEGYLQVFINEVVILSQINHRNVVKLLGCCLETEVPRLVYEFVPNGTLFQHIHDPSEEFPLTWEMRVRIAREVAGALAYLHSAASAPIYHRDIKSTNILLDNKYRAKVSDFGTSRSVAIDQTHLTTRVLGTFGYLDPEYFQSSQFTEKSDVYSFGVVVVELLTGEKAVTSVRAEVGRNLATHFLHSMEENQLFDILDAKVLKEGQREEIMAMAELARRCLHLNGKSRPTMKEVAHDLEGIQLLKEGSAFLQKQDDSRECHSIQADESGDFSSISGSMHFDTITTYSPDTEHPLLGEN